MELIGVNIRYPHISETHHALSKLEFEIYVYPETGVVTRLPISAM